jgi:hypothetical protein
LIFSCAHAALDSKMLVSATAPIPLFNIILSSQFNNVASRRDDALVDDFVAVRGEISQPTRQHQRQGMPRQ